MSKWSCPKCKYSCAKVNDSPKMIGRFDENGSIKEEGKPHIRWDFIGWELRFECKSCGHEFDEPAEE